MVKIILSIIFFLYGCRTPSREMTHVRVGMDTIIEIKTECSGRRSEMAINNAFEEFERIDKKFSAHDDGSLIYKINSSSVTSTYLDEETRKLIEFALKISSVTKGAFDITLLPVLKLWDTKGKQNIPSALEVKRTLEKTGWLKIKLTNNMLQRNNPDIKLDLGGFVKGYAVDRAVDILRRGGIKSGLVNAGGDIRVFGEKYWNIGIQHPRKNGELLGDINLKNKSIVTSGDYERFFIKDGKRYHHIINPKTGYPADELMSVTIIADTCMLADALATAVFVLGPKDGLELINNQKNIECIIVDNKGNILVSEGLKAQIAEFNF